MDKKELIIKIKVTDSNIEFFKLKKEIIIAIGNNEYSKSINKIESVVDFYAEKKNILDILSGKTKTIKEGI